MPNTSLFGVVGLEALMAERLQTMSASERWDVIQEFGRIHDELVAEMDSIFVQNTTERAERVMLPMGGGSLQPLDDKGVPYPTQVAGFYDVGYPIQGGGTAWANNRVTRAKMKPEEVSRFLIDSRSRDNTWRRMRQLAAMFTNTSYVFNTPGEPATTVFGLANSDAVLYLRNDGTLATDTHYLAQAAGIADATNPYTVIRDALREHPANAVSPANPIMSWIAPGLRATTEALTDFVPVTSAFVNPGATVNTIQGVTDRGPGEFIGIIGEQIIKVLDNLPAGYILSVTTGGPKVLRFRQYEEAELQGLIAEKFSPDGNREDYRYIRYGGYGVYNRVGATAYLIGAGAYAIPTGFTAPLAA